MQNISRISGIAVQGKRIPRLNEMSNNIKLKPFVKWAGGKTQLIPEIVERFPDMSMIDTYVEPFVGGGAMLFYILENYPHIKCVINDINRDLINAYQVIKFDCKALNSWLKVIEDAYNGTRTDDEKKEFYYLYRERFNHDLFHEDDRVWQAAVFIALNKLGFNGLYRLNKDGKFNVPWGKKKKLNIYNPDYFYNVSNALKNVFIMNSYYSNTEKYAGKNTLYYLDPPYKPLDTTKSKLNQYTSSGFDDEQQVKLKLFCDKISDKGSYLILSNSDTEDGFFEGLYKDYRIKRIEARRAINCKGDKRGKINELLIRNF